MSTVLRLPAATDWYYKALTVAETIGAAGVRVLDGPDVKDASNLGIAVGMSMENPSGEWQTRRSDVTERRGGQTFTLVCLAWARSGETTYRAARLAVANLVRDAETVLEQDPTMGGAVSSAFFEGGQFDQDMTQFGLVVRMEFRIAAFLF